MRRILISIGLLVFGPTSAALSQENEEKQSDEVEISYSDMRRLIDNDEVEWGRVSGDGWWVNLKTKNGERFYAQVTPQTPIADHFYSAGIPVRIQHRPAEEEDELPLWLDVFFNILPLLIFIIFFLVVIRWMGGVGNSQYSEYLRKSEELNDKVLKQTAELHDQYLRRLDEILSRHGGRRD